MLLTSTNGWAIGACLIALLLFSGCEDEPQQSTIGNDLLPGAEVEYIETTNLSLRSDIVDSVQADDPALFLLGEYQDPVFGTAQASFATQFLLGGSDVDFGEVVQLDSITLNVSLASIFGDPTDLQEVHVYELSEQLTTEAEYDSQDSVAADRSNDLADAYQLVQPDSFETADISIRLDNSFGEKIINLPEDNLLDDASFTSAIPGLVIEARRQDPNATGAVWVVNMFDEDAHLRLHYTVQTDTGQTQLTYDFRVELAAAGLNMYRRKDAQGTLLLEQADLPPGQAEYLFLQSGNNVRILGEIAQSFLDSLQGYAINRAYLEIPMAFEYSDPEDEDFALPSTGFMYYLAQDGDYEDVTLRLNSNDGTLALEEQLYFFNITGHLQSILAGRRQNELFSIVTTSRNISFSRVVLLGPGHQGPKPKLKVYYTPSPLD